MIRSKDRDDDKIISSPYDEDDAAENEVVLGLIEDIPDETLDQGNQAVKDWIKTHRSKGVNNSNKARSVSVDSLEARKAELEPDPESLARKHRRRPI